MYDTFTRVTHIEHQMCVFVIPVGELRGERKVSFELPETRIISAASPALQSTLRCDNGARHLNHLAEFRFSYLFNVRGQMFVVFIFNNRTADAVLKVKILLKKLILLNEMTVSALVASH